MLKYVKIKERLFLSADMMQSIVPDTSLYIRSMLMKKLTVILFTCLAVLCTAASCGSRNSAVPEGGSPAASAGTVRDLPEEIMPLLEKYYTCNIMYDLEGINRCYYTADVNELREKAGDFEGLNNMFSPPKEGEVKPKDLKIRITKTEKLGPTVIDSAQSSYTSMDERYGAVQHTISEGYRIELTYYDRNIDSDCDETVGVALINGSEWVVLPVGDEILDLTEPASME